MLRKKTAGDVTFTCSDGTGIYLSKVSYRVQ